MILIPVALVVVALAIVVRVAARQRGVRAPGTVAAVLVIVQAAAMVLLDQLAPFRPGLLSVLLDGTSAALLACGVLARGRRAWAACAAMAAGLFALAVPVRLLQQAVGGWEWTQAGGVPSRAWLQVIDVPGMPQEPYQWDARSRVLTAYFDVLIGPLDMWGAIETVISDRSAPPATLNWADGDSEDPEPARCRSLGPGLWQCAAPAGYTTVGFVRRSGGVMITLTGPMYERADLLHAIRAAHPASDAELPPRSSLRPRTLVGCLLL